MSKTIMYQYQTPEVDPVTGDIVMINRAKYLYTSLPFRVEKEYKRMDTGCDDFISMASSILAIPRYYLVKNIYDRLTEKIKILDAAIERCSSRLRFEMADIWRRKKVELLTIRARYER